MCCLSSDYLKKVVEWYTKYEDLQNLLKELETDGNTGEQVGLTEFI